MIQGLNPTHLSKLTLGQDWKILYIYCINPFNLFKFSLIPHLLLIRRI